MHLVCVSSQLLVFVTACCKVASCCTVAATVDATEYLLQHAVKLLYVVQLPPPPLWMPQCICCGMLSSCFMLYSRRCHCGCHSVFVVAYHKVTPCCTVAAATVDAIEFMLLHGVYRMAPNFRRQIFS